VTIDIRIGDCRDVLRQMPADSVHCCVTSPPYFGLRDYGVAGQIGLEPTPDAFVAEMVAVFREVRRVLRDDGTCWLNLGDSYVTSPPGNKPGWEGMKKSGLAGVKEGSTYVDTLTTYSQGQRGKRDFGTLKQKDLIGIPWRVAFALQADGWYLRQDIIWAKPNPMPESVTDRCTKAHEYLFLLSKSPRYWYDADAIAEESSASDESKARYEYGRYDKGGIKRAERTGRPDHLTDSGGYLGAPTRNRRSVWTVATQPFSEAHFATFPPALIEPCIMAGCPKQCCAKCGAPWDRQTEKTRTFESGSGRAGNMPVGKNGANLQGGGETGDIRRGPVVHTTTTGWQPSCACNADTVPGTVIDPFGGAGTTGLVADRLGRNAVLIELNPAYADMARNRIQGDCPMFAEIAAQ
jgi:DNA modification methylase